MAIERLAARGEAGDDDPSAAAGALEAYFLRQILAEVRNASSSGADSGFAGATFQELLDDALADAIAASGKLGVAEVIAGAMQHGGAPTAPPKALQDPLAALPPTARGVNPLFHAGPRPDDPEARPAVAARVATSHFGARRDPFTGETTYHAGVDLRAAASAPVRAAAAGVVSRAGPAGSYGNLVVIDHGGGVETRYAHLSEVAVRAGEALAVGREVGRVGATGRASGPHLHFEVRRDGRPVDPASAVAALKPGR